MQEPQSLFPLLKKYINYNKIKQILITTASFRDTWRENNVQKDPHEQLLFPRPCSNLRPSPQPDNTHLKPRPSSSSKPRRNRGPPFPEQRRYHPKVASVIDSCLSSLSIVHQAIPTTRQHSTCIAATTTSIRDSSRQRQHERELTTTIGVTEESGQEQPS